MLRPNSAASAASRSASSGSSKRSLRAALRKLSIEGATQEDLITIRGDRFVIPVRSELKRRVSGVVHGASSSGQTVYVEPLETIEQNNELVRLIEEEQAEIHRIFVALTRQVGGYATRSSKAPASSRWLTACWPAPALPAITIAWLPPITPGPLRLEAARHPLLEKHLRATGGQIVPLSRSNSPQKTASSSSAAPTPAAKP